MSNEIGSTFWIMSDSLDGFPQRSLKSPDILNVGESYVSTCRSAIGMALDVVQAERKVALLPGFTCESVIAPFTKRGFEVEPYSLEWGLNIEWASFKKQIEKVRPSVILVHAYFGFDTTHELTAHIQEIRELGIIVIEDMTQSMFSSFAPLHANFHVGSIRKWMPLPDGAFVTLPIADKVTEEDDVLVQAKTKAMTEKGDWIMYGIGEKESLRRSFTDAEEILDSRDRPYLMSSISRELYDTTDISKMREARRMNYYYLENKIWNDEKLACQFESMLPPISRSVCPFHFPVLVKDNRKELQQYLASKDIYATVIWRIPDEFEDKINDSVRYIYDHILCFHIDQRYSIIDMERIVEVLNQYYS